MFYEFDRTQLDRVVGERENNNTEHSLIGSWPRERERQRQTETERDQACHETETGEEKHKSSRDLYTVATFVLAH